MSVHGCHGCDRVPHDAMDASSLTVAINEDVEAITALVGAELFEGDDFLGVRHGRRWKSRRWTKSTKGPGSSEGAKGYSITNGLISIRHAF